MNSEEKIVASNMMWRMAERIGAESVNFVVSLVLARLLIPEAYGIVSIITVITSFLKIFVDSSLSNALIQKKDADQIDFSTVFIFNLLMGLVMYLLMFFSAPMIGKFYKLESITAYIRVSSLTLVLGGINGIQNVIVAKRMQFKRFFYATLIGTIISAVVGVSMAYNGCGAWALIAQTLTNQTFDTLFLWISLKWFPSFKFSFIRLKNLMEYGIRMMGAALLDSFSKKLTGALVGKYYSVEDLAYYDKGEHIPGSIVQVIQPTIQSVLFPVMANAQDSKEKVRYILQNSIRLTAYLLFPCMMGLAVCSRSIVILLYTEKWVMMVPFFQLFCFSRGIFLITTANLQVLRALGKSRIYFQLEIVKESITILGLLISIHLGIVKMLFVLCIIDLLVMLMNMFICGREIDYSIASQLKDLFPTVILTLIMGLLVKLLEILPIRIDILFLLQIFAGIAIYIIGSSLFGLESYSKIKSALLTIIKERMRHKKA